MSIEKFTVLYFPFKARTICTLTNAKIVSLVTAVVFIIFDAQFFYLSTFGYVNGLKTCVYVDEKYGFVIERIKSIIYTFGPFSVMTLTSLAITFKFCMVKRKSGSGSESTNQAVNSATRGTVTLLLLSFSFIVLTAPASIYGAIVPETEFDHVVYTLLIVIQFMNHSINAVLYCIVGTRFRAELIKMVTCKKENAHSESNHSGLSTISVNVSF